MAGLPMFVFIHGMIIWMQLKQSFNDMVKSMDIHFGVRRSSLTIGDCKAFSDLGGDIIHLLIRKNNRG